MLQIHNNDTNKVLQNLKIKHQNFYDCKYEKDFWNSKTEHFWTWNQILVPNKDSLFIFKYNI